MREKQRGMVIPGPPQRTQVCFGLLAVHVFALICICGSTTRAVGLDRASSNKQAGLVEKSIVVAGAERKYLVYDPNPQQQDRKVPLLLVLHGGGGNMRIQADDRFYGQITSAKKYGHIAVFPNGYSRLPRGGLATWNAGKCCGAARDRASDDVGFLTQLIGQLKADFPIDNERVFITGMSNGALMAYRMACEKADLVTAIAAVAGTDNTNSCAPARPVPVLHIHAKDDTHVLFNGGAGKDAFRNRSVVTEFKSVPQTISEWKKHDSCPEGATAEKVFEQPGAVCERISNCANRSSVQLCVTETGGHSWPGGTKPRKRSGAVEPSRALDANQVMWDFFNVVAPPVSPQK